MSGVPYIVNEHLLKNYQSLLALFIFYKNEWISFLPENVIKKTLKAGLDFLGDKQEFDKYVSDFENYRKVSKVFFDDVVLKEKVIQEEVKKFFEYSSNLHYFYIKTEFFYTDEAYLESTHNETIKDNLKTLGIIKNEGREYLNKIALVEGNYLIRFLLILERQFGVSVKSLFQYDMSEILTLFDGVRIDEKTISDRLLSYITKSLGKENIIFVGKEAEQIADIFLKSDAESKNELSGTIANRGKVSGKVKVMKYGYDNFHKVKELIEEMEKGDILVADTTSPELIVACHKASAILTNEGGLMSHAAIISRELGIPCIVALERITSFVKDGDLVDVDAERGIVTILEKNK